MLRSSTYLDDARLWPKLRLGALAAGFALSPLAAASRQGGQAAPARRPAQTAAPREYSIDELTALLAERVRTTGIKAIISDYDGTVQDKTPEDKAVVASDELVAALDGLHAAGIPFNISTNHFFDANNDNAMTHLLGNRLKPRTRAGMMYSVMSGARVYAYGADGAAPKDAAWKEKEFDEAENARTRPILEETAEKLGLKRRDYMISYEMDKTVVEFDAAKKAEVMPLFEEAAVKAGVKAGDYKLEARGPRARVEITGSKVYWKLQPLVDEAAGKAGLVTDDYRIAEEPSRMVIEIRDKERWSSDQALYEAMARANEERGLGYLVQLKPMPTMRHVPYVQYFKAHKGTGARKIVEMLKAQGVIEDESQVLILGDDFKPEGNDLYMAQTLPRALAISVSKTHDASQPNVLQARARGAATIRELLRRLPGIVASARR